MTRAEILSDIKQAEDEAKGMVIQAQEARSQKVNEARSEARKILKSAEEEASKYYMTEIGKAREESRKEKEKLIKKGYQEAEEIKLKAKKNIPKAANFIVTEFERAANA
ncbi:MAG: ATP synthase archaeal subunit H [Candidatus Methanoperedens sp.]|nr:ATP synthase archaeal subunit H [Candidatus Methanoperedens sp.]